MKKELRFTVKTNKSNLIVGEQNVVFGSDERPFPNDWKDDVHAQLGILEHKETLLNELFKVEVSEDLTPSEISPMFTVEQFKNYLMSQDSFGDALYHLKADSIREANKNK